MGTRSITRIILDGKPLLTFYRQFDGYPSGHGKEIADFMSGITIVNGYNSNMRAGTHADGAGCFAAQMLSHLKFENRGDGLGGIYVRQHDAENEEYTYTINLERKGDGWNAVGAIVSVKCEGYGKSDSYEGDLDGFVSFCGKPSHSCDDE